MKGHPEGPGGSEGTFLVLEKILIARLVLTRKMTRETMKIAKEMSL